VTHRAIAADFLLISRRSAIVSLEPVALNRMKNRCGKVMQCKGKRLEGVQDQAANMAARKACQSRSRDRPATGSRIVRDERGQEQHATKSGRAAAEDTVER